MNFNCLSTINNCHLTVDSFCNCVSNSFPDPSKFNLTKDYVFIENEWGSLFYKHIGKQNRNQAKQICSNEGEFVHLPIPRFPEENQFYKTFFATEGLWLGVSDAFEDGVFQSDLGNEFIRFVPRAVGFEQFYHYGWMNASLYLNTNFNGIKMMQSGDWQDADELELLDSVCVYNVVPNNCSNCLNEKFCRYSHADRSKTECVCPVTRSGHYCEINLCSQCKNGGYCKKDLNDEIECICQYPFYGKNCELGLINCFKLAFLFYLYSDDFILSLNTKNTTNPPMIIHMEGYQLRKSILFFLSTK